MAGKEATRLRYLKSDQLEVPATHPPLAVRDRNDRLLGQFDGLIFDPPAGRVRFLVVDRLAIFRHDRYLVPIDPTQLDAEHGAFRVGIDAEELPTLAKFDRRRFPDFSDDDLINALFPESHDQSHDSHYA